MSDLISRQAAIEVIDAVFPVDSMKSEYAQGIACGAALAKTYIEQLPSAQPYTEAELQKITDVLDKIRAEIKALSNANPSYWYSGDMVEREDVLEIINEYMAESEE